MDERRRSARIPSLIPATAEAGGRTWRGTVVNYSAEGALLRLEGSWDGDRDLVVRLDPEVTWEGFATDARLVRATPDGDGTLLAVRF